METIYLPNFGSKNSKAKLENTPIEIGDQYLSFDNSTLTVTEVSGDEISYTSDKFPNTEPTKTNKITLLMGGTPFVQSALLHRFNVKMPNSDYVYSLGDSNKQTIIEQLDLLVSKGRIGSVALNQKSLLPVIFGGERLNEEHIPSVGKLISYEFVERGDVIDLIGKIHFSKEGLVALRDITRGISIRSLGKN